MFDYNLIVTIGKYGFANMQSVRLANSFFISILYNKAKTKKTHS